MMGSEPINDLLVYGKNTIDLEMKVPEANLNDYDCTVNLSLDKEGDFVDATTGGENNIMSFSLRDMIDQGKIQQTKDGTYKYSVTFSTAPQTVERQP